jgi:two-component system sensor histidine kinase MtrB
MFRALTRRWRRSLAFRVVATTLVAATVLVGASLGFLLIRVTNGLVDANTSRSIAEANVGLAAAQQVVLQASEGGSPPPSEGLADSIMNALVTSDDRGAAYEVLLLEGASTPGTELSERGTNLVEVSSVPPQLRAQVRELGREVWTYTTIEYVDQPSEPGLVVGSLLTIGTDTAYEVYYLFPYGELQGTLDLVRSTAWIVGVLLIGLLGLLMSLIARHVVMPVRQAARTAELVRAGHLEQRLPVRGEDDLAALALAFNDMAGSLQTQIRQLENLSRLQQRFVSDVSHELRTPLTTIRMASDVIYESRDDIPPALLRSSELLHDQLDRFESLLSDLLEISRFDAGAAQLETESTDLRDVVGAAVEAARPLARARGCEIVEMFPDHPCVAACDPRRIERIVRNLLSNAIEHGEGQPIEVRVAVGTSSAAVSVRDFGRGLDDDDLDRVFDRFWRADPSRVRNLGGTGLGLSIALEDTRLHAGRLAVWGRPGLGAVFRLTLPRVAGQDLDEASPLPLDPTEVGV